MPVLVPYGGANYHEAPLITDLPQPGWLSGLVFYHFADCKFFDHWLPLYIFIFSVTHPSHWHRLFGVFAPELSIVIATNPKFDHFINVKLMADLWSFHYFL